MRSAAYAFCSTMSPVVPRRGMSAMIPNVVSTSGGDSPSDGSSNRTSRGRAIRARAMASICCSPPESVPAVCRRRSARSGKWVATRSRSSSTARRSRRTYAPISRFSRTVRWGKTRRPSGQWAMPAARTSAGSAPWIGRPSNTMRPRVGASRPETARSVDVLPAPLAPITQTSSPGYTTRSRPRRTATGPYAAWRSSRLSNGARSDTAIDGPQVGADDVRVRLDRGGGGPRGHAGLGSDRHGVRDGHDHPHIVLDQEDGGALVTDSTDQVGHRRLLGGGHAGAGLVEEEEPWPGPERHCELHEPLLPYGEQRLVELARPLGAAMAEAHEVDDPVGVSAEPRLLGGGAAAPGDHGEESPRAP